MENQVKKREWVKNAAIIFLSVMLVLTFFSNTFMNYSLPEVSTQYVQSGSINTKIRGSGTVVSNGKYEVILPENQPSRNVEAILVRPGQQVTAGDVIMMLESVDDSESYYAAKDALTQAQIEYAELLLEQGEGEEYASLKAAVESARDSLSSAGRALDDAEDELNKASTAKNNIAKALKTKEDAQKDLKNAKRNLELLLNASDSEKAVNLKIYLDEAVYNYNNSENTAAKAAWKDAADKYAASINELFKADETEPDEITVALVEEILAVSGSAKYDVLNEAARFEKAEKVYNEVVANNPEASNYDSALSNYNSYDRAYDDARDSLSDARDALDKAMKDDEKKENVNDMKDSLAREQAAREIEKAKKALEAFGEEGDASNEVVAKNAGTVSEINATVGKPVYGGDTVAVIDIEDAGYSVSFSVTAEQAKKLSIGDTADVENYYWWGSEITAVLDSIKTEQGSGGAKKVLTFNLKGDIEPDVNLNLSIGQKSQNYEAIVPNSAIRNDTNGSFVLVLTTKSSPLNNRYVATRVDVNVFASDDLNSAVSGLGYGDYVITTSSKPIEAGTLVRMAEG